MTSIFAARRALSPAIARLTAAMLRSGRVPGGVKRRIWRWSEHYNNFFPMVRDVTIPNGMTIRVDTTSIVQKHLYFFGMWEPAFTRLLLERTERGGTFLDIGANVGYFTLLASELFDGVVAIEASPSVFAALERNVAANGLGHVRLVNQALGEAHGTLAFYRHATNDGGSSLIPGQDRAFEAEVAVAPLQALVTTDELRSTRFVKVDIEGYDHVALRQLIEVVDILPDDVTVLCEYDPTNPALWPEVERFRSAGFSLGLLQGVYDVEAYIVPEARTAIAPVHAPPDAFCDLLMVRGPRAAGMSDRTKGSP